MKDYHEIFSVSTTDTVYYDELLLGKLVYEAGNVELECKIEEMSPSDYLNECCEMQGFKSLDELLHYFLSETKMVGLLRYLNKNKFPLPYLNRVSKNQEGRHRAVIAEHLGYRKMPVLIVLPK